MGGVARPKLASRVRQLATASNATRLASKFVHTSTACSPQAPLLSFELVLPVQSFIKQTPQTKVLYDDLLKSFLVNVASI
jgi:hypothetical protein